MKHSITPEEHARVQRRRGRQALGLLVAILVVVGFVTVLRAGVGAVANLFDDTEQKQEYEDKLEGLVLFVVLWIFSARPRKAGAVSGLFALLYAVFRFGVEFVRVPDAQLGYLAFGWLTMGQLLCLPLMAAGLWLLCRTPREQAAVEPATAPRKGKSARKR